MDLHFWCSILMMQVWPQADYPLVEVGRLVLDRNPSNFFVDVEQIAFSPAHMVPGIEASPDKMLHVSPLEIILYRKDCC